VVLLPIGALLLLVLIFVVVAGAIVLSRLS
jgi:hypothetical protein